MKKLTVILMAVVLMYSCKRTDAPANEDQRPTKRSCAAEEVLEAQMAADPSLKARMDDIEAFTKRVIASGAGLRTTATTIEIPVVVHVLYNKAVENISDAQ